MRLFYTRGAALDHSMLGFDFSMLVVAEQSAHKLVQKYVSLHMYIHVDFQIIENRQVFGALRSKYPEDEAVQQKAQYRNQALQRYHQIWDTFLLYEIGWNAVLILINGIGR